MNCKKKNKFKEGFTVGFQLGCLIVGAASAIALAVIGLHAMVNRNGALGGEIFILPTFALTFYLGRAWEQLKEKIKAWLASARTEAEAIAGRQIDNAAWSSIYPVAVKKLAYIIGREGDANGERRRPRYLGQLAAEAIDAADLTARCVIAAHKKAGAKDAFPSCRPTE